jgi:hypothetical protein
VVSKKKSVFVVILCLLLFWLVLLVIGSEIQASLYTEALREDRLGIFLWFPLFFFSWTWTNVCVACCLSSLIGEVLRGLNSSRDHPIDWLSAPIRGFFVFLLLIAGQIVIVGGLSTPSATGAPDQVQVSQYFRIFATASLISFLIGYRPELLLKFVDTLTKRTDSLSDAKRQEPLSGETRSNE